MIDILTGIPQASKCSVFFFSQKIKFMPLRVNLDSHNFIGVLSVQTCKIKKLKNTTYIYIVQ